jgi:NAD(P)-dependent dehydrogenase (short-subunit alcohol dehydrogenase family)
MTRFEGKVVLITGAASGLGKATALHIAREGGALSLVDLNAQGLDDVKAAILEVAPDAQLETITADVSKEADVESYVAKTVERFGKIDGFYNNAGIEGKQNLTEEYGSDEFAKVIGINLNGVFFGLKHVLKVMKEQGFGSVVNTASVGGIRGVGNQSGYAAAKHGVVGLTRNSAIEYGQFGITINAIAPGHHDSPGRGIPQADRPRQLGRGRHRVRERQPGQAFRQAARGRSGRRVPAVGRGLVRERHRHPHRRRAVLQVLELSPVAHCG